MALHCDVAEMFGHASSKNRPVKLLSLILTLGSPAATNQLKYIFISVFCHGVFLLRVCIPRGVFNFGVAN